MKTRLFAKLNEIPVEVLNVNEYWTVQVQALEGQPFEVHSTKHPSVTAYTDIRFCKIDDLRDLRMEVGA